MAVDSEPDGPVIGDPGGGGGGGDNTGTVIRSLTITKTQGDSLLRVLVSADLSSPDDLWFTAFLTIGGIIRKVTPINFPFDELNSRAQGPLTMVTAVPGLAAGTYQAVLSIRNTAPARVPLTVKAGAYIEFVEIKRAAL